MNQSLEKSIEISDNIKKDLVNNPSKYKAFSGDRPTGNLHLGHYFGTLSERIFLQKAGVELMILIADYQVLTDHDSGDNIYKYSRDLVKTYISIGIDFNNDKTVVFPHSHIPELNQLLVPFLTLISLTELERNPTVKEEIKNLQIKHINTGMLVYPVHQACDILSPRANIVPVGKDQLPHLEITRTIANRFNNKYCKDEPIFPIANALLTETPVLLGLDGKKKMSKSLGNAILLNSSREEIVASIKKATTDSNKHIEYDPINRPEIANLINIGYLVSDRKKTREEIANEIGDGGAKMLKEYLVEEIDKFLSPIRDIYNNVSDRTIDEILKKSIDKVRAESSKTLELVMKVMNMKIY